MEKKKLRILAAGDIHGDSSLTKKLAEKAEKENVDLVILAGDITSPIDSKNLIKPFQERKKKVLLIPGNWDSLETIDFLAEFYGMKNIHGYSIKYKDVGIFGAGGARGFNVSDKELFETLKKGNSALSGLKKKIMVTHMHAKGTGSEFSGFEGSHAIRKAIEKFQPDLLLHSHIHEAEGIEDKIGKTRIVNVGRSGKILEI
jgi:Icc-related predicted phosphoesterase